MLIDNVAISEGVEVGDVGCVRRQFDGSNGGTLDRFIEGQHEPEHGPMVNNLRIDILSPCRVVEITGKFKSSFNGNTFHGATVELIEE